MQTLPHTSHPAARAAPLAIAACLLWGSAFAVVKMGLAHVPPLTFAGVRFILAGCLLIPLCGRPRAGLAAVRKNWRLVAAVSGLQTVVLYGTFFVGMRLVGGAQAAVLLGSSPLVTALLAHVMIEDDRMTLAKTGAIALGMGGVAIIAVSSKPWSSAGLTELGGMALLTVGVIAGNLSNVVVARSRAHISPLVLNSAQMGLGGMVLLGAAMIVEGLPRSVPPWEFFAQLLYLAMISAAAFSIWFYLLKRVKVSQLNMWKFLIPIFGAILSWVLLSGESPDLPTVAGMICVASAVLLAYYQDVRANRAAGRSSPE